MGDNVVLSYHNSLLRRSDVELLHNPHWLNDQLIGFWFEYLENDIYVANNSICLISPEVVQFIKLGSPVETCIFLDPLDLGTKSLILLPVNNSVSMEQPGGSHWSLLVYDCLTKTYFHLDSLSGGENIHHAEKIAKNMNLSSQPIFELESTQQQNFWDCGVFVCCNAEHVINHCLLEKKELKSLPLLSQEVASQQRERMLKTISTLAL